MSGVLLSKPMRFFFLVSGAIIWIGILLTGVRIVHWILFVPALFFPFAAITGICPGILVSKKLFGGKAAADDSPDSGSDMVAILTSSDAGEVALVKSLLQGESIPYLAQGEEFSVTRGGGALPVRMLVPQEAAERARELIQELIENRSGK